MTSATNDSFAFTLSFEDYLASNRLFLRRNWLWRGALRVGGAIALFYALLFAIPDILDAGTIDPIVLIRNIALGLLSAAALVGLILLILIFWRLPRSARKAYRELKIDGVRTTVDFGPDRLEISNRFGTSTHEWSDLVRWWEDEHMLLLLRTSQMYYAFPKHQIATGTLEALRQSLTANGVKSRW